MKLSPMVKNNKTLILVLVVTFICACVMSFHCLVVYSDIQDVMKQIENDDAAMQQINKRKNPNPVKMSEKIILANTEQLRARIVDLRRKIGNPYRNALKDFLCNLESTSRSAVPEAAPQKADDAKAATTVSKPEQLADQKTNVSGSETAKTVAAAPATKEQQTQPPAAAATPATPVEDASKKVLPAAAEKAIALHYTESEIRKAFADLYESYYQDRKNADNSSSQDNERLVEEYNELFNRFRERLTQPPGDMKFETEEEKAAYIAGARETFDNAFNKFHAYVVGSPDKKNIETIDVQNAKFIFLHALGLPRTMTSFNCKIFVDTVLSNIKRDPSIIPGLEKMKSDKPRERDADLIETKIPAFTFNHKNMRPPPGNVVHILRHYRILDDLFRRMRESKIQYLVSVASPFSEKPTGDLSGDVIRELGVDYRKFTYEVTIVSTVNEIGSFVNSLHQAFEQNYVYDIQEMSFFKAPQMDEVKNAYDKVQKIKEASEVEDVTEENSAAKENENAAELEGGSQQNGEAAEANRKKTRKLTPEELYTNPEYGAVVIGHDDRVTAVIKFNYIEYIGENLGMKKD